MISFRGTIPSVEFVLEMARQANEVDLQAAAEFLERYEVVYKLVDERYDVRGSDLANLVRTSLLRHGTIPLPLRLQLRERVPEAVFDYTEQVVRTLLEHQGQKSPGA